MSIIYVILAILLFGVLVGIHEFGHFIMAKACNVRVEEFSLGMGPAIFKKQKGETLYALRCVPFGGYCAMSGEDEESEDPRAFTNMAAWKRIIILVAGSFMNFVLGLVIVFLLYSGAYAFRSTELVGFMEGCPYESTQGLQLGDRIWKIDGKRCYQYYNVNEFLAAGDGVYDIVVLRDGKKVELDDFTMVPIEYPDQETKMYGFYMGYEEATLPVKLRNTWNTCMEFSRMVWMGLSELTSGNVQMDDMAGPVGIVDMMAETGASAESTSDALYRIFYFTAFIAVNLAIMNMLPIPALDGGRVFLLLVTVIIEKIIGKKLDPKYEGYIHAGGMILLLGLMAMIMFNDIIRIVTG